MKEKKAHEKKLFQHKTEDKQTKTQNHVKRRLFSYIAFNLRYIPFEDLLRIVHAFIFSCLDFCNALYTGITQGITCCCEDYHQFKTTRSYTVTPILASMLWHPLDFCIDL